MKRYKTLMTNAIIGVEKLEDVPTNVMDIFISETFIDFKKENLICAFWAEKTFLSKPASYYVIVTDIRIISKHPTHLEQNYWDSVTGIEKNILIDTIVLSAGKNIKIYGKLVNSTPTEVLKLTFKQANIAFNNHKIKPETVSNSSTDENIHKLEKLKSLLDSGVLNQEEFNEKKKSILDNI
ncbi:SHOCT domain-containing protein [Flavobacteriaceae bacterium]|nr:SHOCT domain-containing protein [Flavobacteriaceae bacterium]